MLQMRLVPVPNWARPFALLREEEFDEQEFNRCSSHHDEVLQAVQEAVEQYVNDGECVFSKEQQSFPERDKFTGEYYISRENYSIYEGPIYRGPHWVRPEERQYSLSVMVHCLGKQWIENQTDFDYLGLELYFWWKPAEQKFQYIGDIDSSSI